MAAFFKIMFMLLLNIYMGTEEQQKQVYMEVEVCSEYCQTSMMELFVKVVNSRKSLTIFRKSSILNV